MTLIDEGVDLKQLIDEKLSKEFDDLWDILLKDPELARPIHDVIVEKLNDVNSQLGERRETLTAGDISQREYADWRRKCLYVKRLVERRTSQAKAALKLHAQGRQPSNDDAARFSAAIRTHKRVLFREGWEPTDNDLRLWAVIDS